MDSSPLSACSDNSDANERVYFGPMLSPEKKQLPFLPASSPTLTFPFTFVSGSSAARRSPRLSTSPLRPEHGVLFGVSMNPLGEQEEEEEEEELSGVAGSSMPWNGTPLQNILRRDGLSLTFSLRCIMCSLKCQSHPPPSQTALSGRSTIPHHLPRRSACPSRPGAPLG